MKQGYKILVIAMVGLVFLVFIVLRLSSALPVLVGMKNDLWSMVWTRRNDNYQTKIERFWYEDNRYSNLILKIVPKDKTVYLGDIFSEKIHPMIIKNFVYPIHVSDDPFDNNIDYYGFYPGINVDKNLSCKDVFVFSLVDEKVSRIGCAEYFSRLESYSGSYGLIELL